MSIQVFDSEKAIFRKMLTTPFTLHDFGWGIMVPGGPAWRLSYCGWGVTVSYVRCRLSLVVSTPGRSNLAGQAEEQEIKTEYGDKRFHDERVKNLG